MAKRTRGELELIKSLVDRTYNRFGNALIVNTEKPYDPKHSELGFCYKYVDPVSGNVTYKIECSKLGIDRTDFRVMMHEYGHIYLAHLEGIHEELDTQICNIFRDNRGKLIDEINASCGIDFADKLIERVIDDPILNHSLHNIAMDMEVNSSILSKDDIEEMEMDITSILPKTDEELLKYMMDNAKTDEEKQKIQDALNKMQNEAKIKLILPERYYLSVAYDQEGKVDISKSVPFPDDLTYPEYLMLIIEHLDQFVKMLVSIKMGGNGDTSQVTQQDIQNALNNMAKNWAGKSDAYKQGYSDALRDYKNQQQQNQNGQSQDQQQQGQAGQNPSSSQQGQDQGQQGQGMGQTGQDSTSQQGDPSQQGQGGNQPAPNGQQSQSGQGQSSGQGNSGMSAQDQADYNQGYQDAMNDLANGMGQNQGQGMQGLSDLMNDMGMSPGGSTGEDKTTSPYQGTRQDPFNDQDAGKDHRTDSRDEADKKRELGEIRSGGGVGCGNNGGPYATRDVDKDVDEVDMALQEVMHNVRTRVIKQDTKKDLLKLYNRGIVRSVIAPTVSRKVTICNDPKIVYLIDISGSMDTRLVDRILKTIAKNMKKLSRGLRYDIITWSTHLGEHIKDIDPRKGVPRISMGGGTRMAGGIKYFKEHYGPEAILIVISDFEDYLEEWHTVEMTMPQYAMYGFNYGYNRYGGDDDKIDWKYMKVRKFDQTR